jgi:hypothetical protein
LFPSPAGGPGPEQCIKSPERLFINHAYDSSKQRPT